MLLLLLWVSFCATVSAHFENTLTAAPTVSCNRGSISLDISSTRGAPSVVFAKGHFNKDQCSFRNHTHVTFDFDKCNIRRKREVSPRGMAYSMTVVVQLHPLFITKVDRAYAVRCFYMEAEKNVGAALGVSELTTALLAQEHDQPTCEYSLHKDSSNGPLLKYAHVGDIVYHVWSCPSDVYAMLIHSCVVQDGQGQEQRVVDENGCSTDLYLMPELIYAQDLTKTFTASNAFNFPDVTSVQFSCQIKLCFKGNGGCDTLTPPKCGTNAQRLAHLTDNITGESPQDLDSEQLLTTHEPITHDIIFGEVQDHKEITTILPMSTPRRTVVSSTTETVTADVKKNETDFPKPKTLREFIKDKYGNSVEGSGLDAEITETEKKRDIKRRDTETVDLDILSPELTILDKEIVSDPVVDFPAAALSSSQASTRESVCVPLTAFWLLIALVLLSLSFLLVAICKASSKKGFVQF